MNRLQPNDPSEKAKIKCICTAAARPHSGLEGAGPHGHGSWGAGPHRHYDQWANPAESTPLGTLPWTNSDSLVNYWILDWSVSDIEKCNLHRLNHSIWFLYLGHYSLPPSHPYDIHRMASTIYKALANAGSGICEHSSHAHSAYAAGFRWRPLRQMFITRLHRATASRDRLEYMQPTHLRRSAGHRCLLQRFESAPDAHRLGNGQICETRRDHAPLNM